MEFASATQVIVRTTHALIRPLGGACVLRRCHVHGHGEGLLRKCSRRVSWMECTSPVVPILIAVSLVVSEENSGVTMRLPMHRWDRGDDGEGHLQSVHGGLCGAAWFGFCAHNGPPIVALSFGTIVGLRSVLQSFISCRSSTSFSDRFCACTRLGSNGSCYSMRVRRARVIWSTVHRHRSIGIHVCIDSNPSVSTTQPMHTNRGSEASCVALRDLHACHPHHVVLVCDVWTLPRQVDGHCSSPLGTAMAHSHPLVRRPIRVRT